VTVYVDNFRAPAIVGRIRGRWSHCYALTLARRLKAMGSAKYQTDGNPATSGPGFGITEHPAALREPYGWRKPRTVFVNSMSDLFHHGISDQFIRAVWDTMAATDQHRYLILTKRPARARALLNRWVGDPHGDAPLSNVELGTSIESDDHVVRAHHLRETPAAVRFISAEPLLGPLPSLDLAGIDQLIVGGESGPGARPMDLGWVRELIRMARDANTAVFVKQLGTRWAGSGKGGNWDVWPEDLRIREFPANQAAGEAVVITGPRLPSRSFARRRGPTPGIGNAAFPGDPADVVAMVTGHLRNGVDLNACPDRLSNGLVDSLDSRISLGDNSPQLLDRVHATHDATSVLHTPVESCNIEVAYDADGGSRA
jgi:protein gp37